MTDVPGSVTCTFERCSASMIDRVVVAAVEQLSAHADTTIQLLDALEYPLGLTVHAVAALGIVSVDIEIVQRQLILVVHLRTGVNDPLAALGESADVVTSFFEVSAEHERRSLVLTGSLD